MQTLETAKMLWGQEAGSYVYIHTDAHCCTLMIVCLVVLGREGKTAADPTEECLVVLVLVVVLVGVPKVDAVIASTS